jgi:hypothetical protein
MSLLPLSAIAGGFSSPTPSDNDNGGSPSPHDIVHLAASFGYVQRRPMVSSTIFLVEKEPPPYSDMPPPILINIFYTTRSIMTQLKHPTFNASSDGSATNGGQTNELWRSNAYDTLQDLQAFFVNPRQHTGKGYRNAAKAVRGCVTCGELRVRTDFSKSQWAKGPDGNKCNDCLGGGISELTTGLENIALLDDGGSVHDFPLLTLDLIQMHNNSANNIHSKQITDDTERRQFSCPDCPKYGRGDYVFFKKVPTYKPVVKCPQCKKASRGKCKRLYPIPKVASKGYGLYKCVPCGDKWGSSRAVADIGQECFGCRAKGVSNSVTPFRMEVYKKKKGTGGGKRRVPKEPIGEDETDERHYGDADQLRNEFAAGGGGAPESSYEFEPRALEEGSTKGVERVSRIPADYKHKCNGCASGVCKNRRVPKSEVHDVSDGNTVSTRASIVTNSSIDKTDFVDRDEDFSGYEDNEWVEV